jgi:hypothetical protein
MVYFENAVRWSFFHHNLKMHGPSYKKNPQLHGSKGFPVHNMQTFRTVIVTDPPNVITVELNGSGQASCLCPFYSQGRNVLYPSNTKAGQPHRGHGHLEKGKVPYHCRKSKPGYPYRLNYPSSNLNN